MSSKSPCQVPVDMLQVMTVVDSCIECQWCGLWEHSQCSGLPTDVLKVLGNVPSNVVYLCSVCQPKVSLDTSVITGCPV